jgi:hypothetical protein
MKPTTDLFELIGTLTKQEKRYFRLHANRQHRQDGDKSYLVVFVGIEQQVNTRTTYDEALLRAELRTHPWHDNLPSIKRYLHDLILESLELFHAGRTPEDELYSLLRRIGLLVRRNLPQQAQKLIRRGLQLAREYHLLLPELELLRWDLRLISTRLDVKTLETFATEALPRQRALLLEYRTQSELVAVYTRLTMLERTQGLPRTPEELGAFETLRIEFQHWDASANATPDTLYFNQLGRSVAAYTLGDYATAERLAQQVVAALAADAYTLRQLPLRYLGSLNHLLHTQRAHHRYADFEHTLTQVQAFAPPDAQLAPAHFEAVKFCCLAAHTLHLFADRGAFTEHRPEADRLLRDFEAQRSRLAPLDVFALQLNFFHFYFGCGEFRTALGFLTQILNRADLSYQRNMTDYCRILLLITHFELGNIDVLEDGLIRNTHRYFSSRGKLDGVEAFFVRMLQVVIDMPSANELLDGLQWALPRLQELEAAPVSQPYFRAFDPMAWVLSKLHRTPYAQELRARRVGVV